MDGDVYHALAGGWEDEEGGYQARVRWQHFSWVGEGCREEEEGGDYAEVVELKRLQHQRPSLATGHGIS